MSESASVDRGTHRPAGHGSLDADRDAALDAERRRDLVRLIVRLRARRRRRALLPRLW